MNIGFTNFGNLDVNAINWANGCPTKPSGDYLYKLSNFIKQLKSNGTWWKLDTLQIYATEFQDNATTAIKGVNPTLVSSPTFTALRGITTNGSTNYINTGFALNTSVFRVQNTGGFGYYTRTNLITSTFDIGTNTVATNFETFRPNASGVTSTAVNGAQVSSAAGTGQSGPAMFAGIRTSSTSFTVYKNSTVVVTNTSTSAAFTAQPVYIGCRNNNGTAANFTAKQFSLYFSAGFSLVDYVNFYNTFEIFRQQVGF